MRHIFPLLLLSLFIITQPTLDLTRNTSRPEVLAIYSTEPPLPTKKIGLTQPILTATAVYVIDLDSGSVLLSKNAHQRLKPASLTKIMTALVAMDHYAEDSVLRVFNGQKSLGSSMDLIRGDQLLLQDLLYGLLVSSGNDAAVTLAENYPGGYRAFVDQMNAKVTDLGLTNTHFTNVSGVESQNHFTSAHDITEIARSALNRPIFSSVVSTKKTTLQSLTGNNYPLVSTNILLDKPGFFGVKTGWTPEAGECLVILYERDGHQILISLLHSDDRFGEGQIIADWVFNNYTWK